MPTRPLIRATTLILLTIAAVTRADDLAGTFRDDRLTLTLHATAADAYAGTLTLAGKTFPFRATRAGTTLTGQFTDGAATHPFTATLAADALSFTTGATTYRLQRQQPPAAPAKPLDPQPGGVASATPAPNPINTAMQRARAYLYARQSKGHWDIPTPAPDPQIGNPGEMKIIDVQNSSQWGGLSALATYALLASGESDKDPRLAPAIEFLKHADLVGTYAVGTRLQVWNILPGGPRKEILDLAKRDRDTLLKNARTEPETRGMFRYSTLGFGYDHSASQFGVLGLWAAEQIGAEVPTTFWKNADATWARNQDPTGGWNYGPEFRPRRPLTLSMTAAGVATLFITTEMLAPPTADCRGNQPHKAIDAGIQWIVDHYDQLPKEEWPYYTLYGIERIALASGLKYLGTVDWFKHGADTLLASQQPDGSWGNTVADTAFGLLFLSRGRAPLVMNKLRYNLNTHGDTPKEANWNQRPRDAANVTRWIGRQLERELAWQIVNLSGPAEDLLDAPILYISGNQSISFTPEEEDKLRRFAQQGGLIVGHADCAHAYFATAFKKLGPRLFPGQAFRDLPAGHVIYTNLFNRDRWKAAPPIQGLSNGARELMVLLPADPARYWQTGAYRGREWAHEVMANLFLYVNDRRDLRFRGESWTVTPRPDVTPTRTIKLARLQHDANWDPEPAGWPRLAAILHNDARTALTIDAIKLGDGTLPKSGHRIAHLTSATPVKLTDPQRADLKAFIQSGGTLLIDAAGGNSDTATSLEAEIAQLTPKARPEILPPGHPAYANLSMPVDAITFRPYAARRQLGQAKGPRLRAATIDGRPAIFYSPEDLSVGLVGQPVDGITGYTPASAAALVRSVLQYAAGR